MISYVFALVHAVLLCCQELCRSSLAIVNFPSIIETTGGARLGACRVIIQMNHQTPLGGRVTTSAVSGLNNYLDQSGVTQCATVVDASALRDVVRAVGVSSTAWGVVG